MKTISFAAFLLKHKSTLVETIQHNLQNRSELSDADIKAHVLKDADLKAWAISLGVKC